MAGGDMNKNVTRGNHGSGSGESDCLPQSLEERPHGIESFLGAMHISRLELTMDSTGNANAIQNRNSID
jgi:hypothetical protein